jgi:uncharacterized protein (TIGR02594 family)
VRARELVGLKEIVGSKHEAKVVKFFEEAGHPEIHDDETAWCAAFANAMLRRAGYAGTGALNARSFLTWGKKLDKPQLGCIVVFKRGNSSWQGHVAFFLADRGSKVEVLGGNQSNSVSIARYNKKDVLGYRWPKVKASAATAPAAPDKKPDANGPMSGKYNPVTEGVQRSLADMGYQPGFYDGKWGGATRGAVAAFQNDRHMAGKLPVIDDELVAEIAKAKAEGFTRPIAKERAEATSDDLKTIVPEVGAAKKAGFWAKVQGWFSSIFGGITVGGVASNLMDAKSNVDTVHSWFGDNAGMIVGVACAAAVIVVAIYLTKKASGAASEAAEASTAAFNTGARR